MAGPHASAPGGHTTRTGSGWDWPGTIRTLLTVFGAIGALVGIVILIPADEQYVGIGNWTWRTSELSNWWGIGFLGAGLLLILGAFIWPAFIRRQREH